MPKYFVHLGCFSDPAFLILSSVVTGPKYGYTLMEDIRQCSWISLEPGTLYAALRRLEQYGWIEALPCDGTRRPYGITANGMAFLQAQFGIMRRIVSIVGWESQALSNANLPELISDVYRPGKKD